MNTYNDKEESNLDIDVINEMINTFNECENVKIDILKKFLGINNLPKNFVVCINEEYSKYLCDIYGDRIVYSKFIKKGEAIVFDKDKGYLNF